MSYIGIFTLILYLFLGIIPEPSMALDRDLASFEIDQLHKNIQSNPENVKSRRFLFEFYCKKKQWKQAVDTILPAQAHLLPEELILLAEAQLELQDSKGAHNVLTFWHNKNAATAHSKFLEGKGFAILAAKETNADNKKNNVLLAVEAFKASIKIDPKQEESYLEWASTIQKNLSVYAEEAVLIYRRLIENNGEKNEYLVDRCRYSVEAKFWDDALKACENAVEKLPENPEAAVFLSQAYTANDKKDLAKQTLLNAVEKNPKSFLARKEMANYYMREENPVAALEQFNAALAIDSSSAETYLGQAKALYQTKRYEEALLAYKQNCKLSRMVASEFKTSMGLLRQNQNLHNRYKNAIDACRK